MKKETANIKNQKRKNKTLIKTTYPLNSTAENLIYLRSAQVMIVRTKKKNYKDLILENGMAYIISP